MLERVNLIENIGKFDKDTPGEDLPLSNCVLLYGENGRGKTTLAAIMKSLSSNDPKLILDRHRLGATNPPRAIFQHSGQTYIFDNGSWSASLSCISVFDDALVSANVCSGIEVATSHGKNLHELILGEQGVLLNEELQKTIRQIEEHNKAIREKDKCITLDMRGAYKVMDFCKLPEINDIDDKIDAAEKILAAAKSADEIKQRKLFELFNLPDFNINNLRSILAAKIGDLETSAAQKVQAHLTKIGKGSENWVSEGLARSQGSSIDIENQDCPFCAQPLSSSSLIEHYQKYFSEDYNSLKERIKEAGQQINARYGPELISAFERYIREVSTNREFWLKFTSIPEININATELARLLKAAHETVRKLLLDKFSSPLEPMEMSDEIMSAIDAYHSEQEKIQSALKLILDQNENILLIKEQAQSENIASLSGDLEKLKKTKIRYSSPTKGMCDDYLAEVTAKKEAEDAKIAARKKLDNYQEKIFPKYQEVINEYLQEFGAGYRLGEVKARNSRAGASCDYKVLINDKTVPLSADTGPSFKTTLSAGDRNTLALAFFFASLKQVTSLSDQIVIIDDPMTSLDHHRSLTTRQTINKLIPTVRQVIILSHEKLFLFALCSECNNMCTAIKVTRNGAGSVLRPWDVNQDCITEHDKNYTLVASYLESAVSEREREVAKALRPILEAYLRVCYPNDFKAGDMLGEFLNRCKQRVGQSDQILQEIDEKELDALKEYANRFHHITNPMCDTEHINETELEQFSKRVLAFIQKK